MNSYHVPLIGLWLLVGVACAPQASPGAAAVSREAPATIRLGYFPNLTHAQAIIGLERGLFAAQLRSDIKLEPKPFNAGPSVIEAMFANELDVSYIGPNPAINGYTRSDGKVLRIIAGAVSGGALFVVRDDSGISKPGDLANKRIASPQLGNTQDVALRAYLQANGLNAKERGGNVEVLPTENPNILMLFQKGDIQGAWVPEPWATRLIKQANGRVFLDERSLWPNGDFVTTHLIVRTEFLEKYPETVKAVLQAHLDATEWATKNPSEAKVVVNEGIRKATGAALPKEVVEAAWENLRITYDPIASSLRKSADDAFKLGFLGAKAPDLKDIYALDLLNALLRERGLKPVER